MTKDDLRNNFDRFHDSDCWVDKRIIYFGSETYSDEGCGESGVDFLSTKKLMKNLLFLDHNVRKPKLITIYFNSPGGDWSHGMAIYDCIRGLRCPIRFVGFGYVRSMGTIICQACDERILTPNTRFMIHDGEEGVYGETKTVLAWQNETKYTLDKMYDIYLEKIRKVKPKFTKKQISDMCSHDYIMSAEDAQKLNLIDKVL